MRGLRGGGRPGQAPLLKRRWPATSWHTGCPGRRQGGDVRLGLSVGYWGFGSGAADQLAMAREAERLGYDSLWAAEAYGSDAATVLAWLAAQTSSIGIGSAVLQIPARSAAMTAMTAATLDRLSGGRFRLGLGLSGPQVAEGWYGQRYAQPLARTRDYIAVVRLALARKRVQHEGETLWLPLPDGPGKALKLTISPVQERVPIYLAAIGPRNTALAGELADGWLPYLFAPDFVTEFRAHLAKGAARAGRDLDGFDVAPSVCVHVSDDLEVARNTMRMFLALYVGGMGSREQNFYNRLVRGYGFEEAAETVQELYLSGRQGEAMAALPDELIDLLTLCGPAGRVRERLAAFREAGVGTLIVLPRAACTSSASSPSWRAESDLRAPVEKAHSHSLVIQRRRCSTGALLLVELGAEGVRVGDRQAADEVLADVRGGLAAEGVAAGEQRHLGRGGLVARGGQGQHAVGLVALPDAVDQCTGVRAARLADDGDLPHPGDGQVHDAEGVAEAGRGARRDLLDEFQRRRGSLLVGLVAGQVAEPQQHLGRHRRARRHRVVDQLAGPDHQRLGVRAGLEEAATLGVAEQLEHGVGQPPCLAQPAQVEEIG